MRKARGNDGTPGNLVAKAGIMAALAACLQLAAGFFPGPGHLLSALGTLPIFLVANARPATGLASLIAASLVVFFIQPLEAPILLLMTGPLGWALGWARSKGHNNGRQVLVGGGVLTAGMLILTYLVGIPAFGPLLSATPPATVVATYLLFALTYSLLWVAGLNRFLPRLEKALDI